MQTTLLDDFIKRVEKLQLNVHGIMVTQFGKTWGEHYWTADEPHVLHSLSKSFTSCAVGMAVSEGRLSLGDKVIDFFQKHTLLTADEKIKALTVRHLLTMAHGRHQPIMMSDQREKIKERDWVHYFLNYPLDRMPGETFVYDTGSTYMLSAIIQEITGQTLRDYLVPRLFQPLGIENPRWDTCPRGRSLGGAGLYLRVSDISRFGNMLLNNGVWEGKQWVPEDYLQEATSKQISSGNGENGPDWLQGYGYQFWMCRYGAYRGDGSNGQFCIVMPDLSAVIAINSQEEKMQSILEGVWECIVPHL
ncbi:CubicO group peptidase (beta-lactamase class C family) [Pullulanibacillus pueri]|uniref:Penicillin-binding protein n=1 Tax=Pullulanibacillus pueri TaxID=1437324 RepID=A0A8J3EMC6_9BACL|nr:serine hydrolase domain-containing protein [Pullulanibacillus pueri]MBM7682076.1 CubicO group peptidase (beta-lactamase class C family) [Pullulanibacillus pueri]GGH80077.1 penicillin-binding protein [Pullulanibacillus pueri]